MNQFRVLYRQFLFRLVDLELLSPDAQGDMNKLLGQFAAVLTCFSVALGLGGLLFDHKGMPPAALALVSLGIEHFLISTTMLVVGLFAVLSWDSTFPDRRDVLVLAPLPVRSGTFFLAKIAAVATGLAIAIGVLNAGPGLSWPISLNPEPPSVLDLALPFLHRRFIAYWVTMATAGTFLFCCVLTLQGLTALLPRRIFLRLSSLEQTGAFALFVGTYFLQPAVLTPAALVAPGNQRILSILPTYWFLGVFEQLSGTLTPAIAPLAARAWTGLAIAGALTAIAYALSYFRTLRRVVEEPDIAPGVRGLNLTPSFGSPLRRAIVRFSGRALARSRQHRVVVGLYLGVGLAIATGVLKDPRVQKELTAGVNGPMLMASMVLLAFWIFGTRIVIAIPVNPRANWIFRVTPLRGGPPCVSAARTSLYLLALCPPLLVAAAFFVTRWPWRPAVEHLVFLGLLGAVIVEAGLYRFDKIPFTCTWLPGKAFARLMYVGVAVGLQTVIVEGARMERRALDDSRLYLEMLAVLLITLVVIRWFVYSAADVEAPVVQFEETAEPVLQGLGLFRDGVLPE